MRLYSPPQILSNDEHLIVLHNCIEAVLGYPAPSAEKNFQSISKKNGLISFGSGGGIMFSFIVINYFLYGIICFMG
jgi:hypothetical protein